MNAGFKKDFFSKLTSHLLLSILPKRDNLKRDFTNDVTDD